MDEAGLQTKFAQRRNKETIFCKQFEYIGK